MGEEFWGVPYGIWAAIIAGVIALIIQAFNARRFFRDASWKRIETGLDLITADNAEKERVGWLILNHLANRRSLSKKDRALVGELAIDLTVESADEDQESIHEASRSIDPDDDLPPGGSAP